MYITLYGATGRTGSRILAELLRRNHQVRAIAREPQPPSTAAGVEWRVDNLASPTQTAATIQGTDAVISAYAPPADNTDALVAAFQTLAGAVAETGVPRLLVVGGAGGLEVAPGVTLIQSGHLPPEWLPIALSHSKAFAMLKATSIDWTYIAPPAFFDPGERTGHYRTSDDHLVTGADGQSRISMEDYAIAMVDELENHKHPRARLAVGW